MATAWRVTLLALLLLAWPAQAAERFVATDGDDGADGSAQRPWRTIQRGVDELRPDDVLTIRGGVYREFVQINRSGRYFGHYITLRAAPGEQVVIDAEGAAGGGKGVIDTRGAEYVRLVEIAVRNSPTCGFVVEGSWQVVLDRCRSLSSARSGIMIDKSGFVTVTGCEVTEACRRQGEESISVKRSQNVDILDSHVHDTGHEGIDVKEGSKHVRVLRNRLHGVERQGLYADAWDVDTRDILFDGNVVFDCGFGAGACAEAGGLLADVTFSNNVIHDNNGPGLFVADWGHRTMSHAVRNLRFVNNTVVNNGRPSGFGGGVWLENAEARDVLIARNVLADNGHGQIAIRDGKRPQGLVVEGNLIHGPSDPAVDLAGNTLAAPQFVDPGAGDYRLKPGSPGHGVAGAMPNE